MPRLSAQVLKPQPTTASSSPVIAFALAQVGDGYQFGATGPDVWDCSGLAVASYARAGVVLPHSTTAMITMGWSVPRDRLQPGDLVFPTSGHVQIYIGRGLVVEATQPGSPVRVGPMWGFATARRLLKTLRR